MLTRRPYDALYRQFSWDVPERLNMAWQVCDRWARDAPDRLAILDLSDGRRLEVGFGALAALADRVQSALAARGVGRGDRVGVLASQSPLCAAAHVAIWRMGAISLPLFTLFEDGALRSRVEDSGARVVVTTADKAAAVAALGAQAVTQADLPRDAARGDIVDTLAEDPAVLIYTSGTTGTPKGALHAHRVLTGHLPGVEMSHDFLGQPDDRIWTPADWAWIGGLFDVAMPALALGVPVVAARLPKFTPDDARRICTQGRVRNVFFPPTVLRMLKTSDTRIEGLRTVASGGEPLGAEMLAWGRKALGVTINEFYGQTECNMVASSAASLFEPVPGTIGRPVPGHRIGVLDADGNETGGEGDIAVHRGSAAMMLGYLNRPKETAAKFRGDWMLTGDRGRWEGAHLAFVGREDDVITSSGYRIGPSEIEDCLMTHHAVATVGVVGKPDPVRTEIVKAYVVLRDGVTGDAALAAELQDWVKDRLARYSYPREIAFLDALPMTVTGKVVRKTLKDRAAAER